LVLVEDHSLHGQHGGGPLIVLTALFILERRQVSEARLLGPMLELHAKGCDVGGPATRICNQRGGEDGVELIVVNAVVGERHEQLLLALTDLLPRLTERRSARKGLVQRSCEPPSVINGRELTVAKSLGRVKADGLRGAPDVRDLAAAHGVACLDQHASRGDTAVRHTMHVQRLQMLGQADDPAD
jgi:hypothetical protein